VGPEDRLQLALQLLDPALSGGEILTVWLGGDRSDLGGGLGEGRPQT
jgi:hypothetical protein